MDDVGQQAMGKDKITGLLKEHGSKIGERAFCEKTGVTQKEWQDTFDTHLWTDVKKEVFGHLEPIAKDIETVWRTMCEEVRKRGHWPSTDEYRLLRKQLPCEPGKDPALPGFQNISGQKASKKWSGSWEGFKKQVREYADLHSEFKDVAELLGVSNPVASDSELDENYERLADLYAETSFTPPVVRSLPQLAEAEDDPDKPRRVDQLFEERVGRAFQVMGLIVEPLGGPNKPDGLVRTSAENTNDPWAIIYDAKKRRDGFRFNKESERQLKDYVREYGEKLRKEKFKRRYFIFVSSRFSDRDEEKARAVKHELGDSVQHVVFMEAAALVELVNKRLSEGANIFNDKMVSRLFRTGILKAEDIN
ncbi:MAG: hypothetical protein V3V10_10200 [Planctomycetota bacterium]